MKNFFFATFAIGFLLAFFVLTYYVWFHQLSMSLGGLRLAAVLFPILIFLFLAFFNGWSVHIANIEQKKFQEKLDGFLINDKTNIQLLLHTTCGYCGNEGARIICNKCDSILWYKITSIFGKTGLFFAHHRWKVSTIIFSVLVISMLGFLYNLINKKEEQISSEKKKASLVLEHISRYRDEIVNIQRNDNLYKNEYSKVEKDQSRRIEKLSYHYKEFSWLCPLVVIYFADYQRNYDQNNFAYKVIYAFSKKYTFEKEIISSLDSTLIEYQNTRDSAFVKMNDGKCADVLFERADKLAQELYYKGRIIGCLIHNLTFNEKVDDSLLDHLIQKFKRSANKTVLSSLVHIDTLEDISNSYSTRPILEKYFGKNLNDESLFFNNTDFGSPKPWITVECRKRTTKKKRKMNKKRYNLVAGVFKNKDNAQTEVRKMKNNGFDKSKIIKYEGVSFAVITDEFSSFEDAKIAEDRLLCLIKDAWVYRN